MYKKLLMDWCDALLELQIKNPDQPRLNGGIMCPACMRIHGRSGDAIQPFMAAASLTKDIKYFDAAKELFDWSEHMVRPDNSYNNDTNSSWNGITVFTTIQLGETLLHYSNILDSGTYKKWITRFEKSAIYLLNNIDKIGGNINYPISCSYAMAIAWKILNRNDFSEKARELAKISCEYITDEGLIYGEGRPRDMITKKGCRPVDLGYNVEESLPSLICYAHLMEDDEVMKKAEEAMVTHLDFMLPDGCWDNSWGSRSFKWSYWGSRTSDGCLMGLALLNNPIFDEAIYRNTKLLQQCTHNGLLYGGLMYFDAEEPPCVHHTICHAKALSALVSHNKFPKHSVNLPCENEQGIKWYPSINVARFVKNNWHGTISDYDYMYIDGGHPTGGSISLLWHKESGPILAGSMEEYYQVEPNNLQMPKNQFDICITPRIETIVNDVRYNSSTDLTAKVESGENNDSLWIESIGKLRSIGQESIGGFKIRYEAYEKCFCITGSTDVDAVFHIPIILSSKENFIQTDNNKIILYKNASLSSVMIETTSNIIVPSKYVNLNNEVGRIFNPVGGFEALPLYIELLPNTEFEIKISENS